MGPGQCDCPEALLLRELVAVLDSPDGVLNRLASTMAVWKLRSMAHEMSAGHDSSRVPLHWSKRHDYDGPAADADTIRQSTAASWAEFYRRQSTEYLQECMEGGAADMLVSGPIIRAILAERT